MSTQHTPGPWEASTDAHGRGRIHGGGAWLASTWLATEDGNNGRHLPAVANARLIAVAPELLEALKACLLELDQEIEQRKCSGNDEDWAAMQRVSDGGHAAIAKATNF